MSENQNRHGLTHVDQHGAAKMVDVGNKDISRRTAKAVAKLSLQPETTERIVSNNMSKGDVLQVARIAGIMAAKRTSELIPLCHQIALSSIQIEFVFAENSYLEIYAIACADQKTGVEMEALTAASIAALTIYDMCKSVDREMTIEQIQLVEKTGGKSDYYRDQNQ